MYQYILFDLDGTVTNTERGVVNAVTYALKHFGLDIKNYAPVNRFIGPPLSYSFSIFCGMDPEQTTEAIRLFREYYAQGGMFECELYPGIAEVLHDLKQRGKTIILATSKAELYAVQILERFGIRPYFDYIAAATLDNTRSAKPDILRYAIEIAGITDMNQALMIGDTKYDILGAKQFGMATLGAVYGFGGKEELLTAGADDFAECAGEIPLHI